MVIIFYAPIGQYQHARNTDLFNKFRIMADHYNRASKIMKIIANYHLRIWIQVICWFVQY